MKPSGALPARAGWRAALPPTMQRLAVHPLTVIALLFAASRAMLVVVGMLTERYE